MEVSVRDQHLEPTMHAFFHYNHWANQTLMALCQTVRDDIATAAIPGTYGSMRTTFAHILKAERSFLLRIQGVAPEPPFTWDGDPSVAEMQAYETTLHHALLELLQHVSPTDQVHESGDGWVFDYDARLIFMSVVYHGIAHRTDITTALALHDMQVPELDVWGYQAAYPERFHARVIRPGQ
jgi:uncharacterized damage-inducible protein DinB